MIRLEPMTRSEFEKFLAVSVETYAKEKTLSGNWTEEESLDKAKEEFSKLLPEGVSSANNYLYTIFDEDLDAGVIWLAKKTDEAGFIYEIRIYDEYQGKGYGKAAMKEIEVKARELGMKKIGLHVFGHNKVARSLYEKIGYETTNVNMVKHI
jgi:ribosomal protein S18 acetylase RimI-like enzyme